MLSNPVKAQKQVVRSARAGTLSRTNMGDYLRLLSDPCKAAPTHAPYGGTGSAYLIRTLESYQPFLTGVGATAVNNLDFVFEYTPWNAPTSVALAVSQVGSTQTISGASLNNFVTNDSLVRSYRPVAACVKWVPTGNYAARSGLIGMSYTSNKQFKAGVTGVSPGIVARQQQRVDGNGTVSHETVWLPSFIDQRFSTNDETNVVGCGSITVSGSNIDATYTAASGGTATLNGYLEITTIWEWVPAEVAETAGGGLVQGAATGVVPPTGINTGVTLDAVLGAVRDVGSFVFQHVGRGMATALSAGVRANVRRGGAMPMLLM